MNAPTIISYSQVHTEREKKEMLAKLKELKRETRRLLELLQENARALETLCRSLVKVHKVALTSVFI